MNYNVTSFETRYNTDAENIRSASRRIKLKLSTFKNVVKFYKKEDSMAFEVGDIVKIVGNSNDHQFEIGEIVKIMCRNNATYCTACDLREEDWWCVRYADIELVEIKGNSLEKGEKIMNNYDEILTIYKRRKREEYEAVRTTKREKYEDAYSKLRDEYNKKFLEQLKKDNREFCYESHKMTHLFESEERAKENSKINEEYYEKINKLDTLVEEVKAQLQLCTTREETLEVLKLYKIVDKNGKIYGCED